MLEQICTGEAHDLLLCVCQCLYVCISITKNNNISPLFYIYVDYQSSRNISRPINITNLVISSLFISSAAFRQLLFFS